jgi:hypothetical protein
MSKKKYFTVSLKLSESNTLLILAELISSTGRGFWITGRVLGFFGASLLLVPLSSESLLLYRHLHWIAATTSHSLLSG